LSRPAARRDPEMVYRYDPCNPCCSSGGGGGTSPTSCGGCSWPTHWSCTINGISSTGACPPQPQTGLANGPPESGDEWPWSGECTGGVATCEAALNGTFTLGGSTGPQGWAGGGSADWSTGFVSGLLCSTSGTSVVIDLYCVEQAILENFGTPGSGNSQISFPFPTSGLLLYLWTTQTAAYWWWVLNEINNPSGGIWWCGGPSYAIPYYCPFNEIECLQPVTLTKLPYAVLRPGTVGPSGAPSGVTFSEGCSGYPSSITITPA
jgi:hypothetical protein